MVPVAIFHKNISDSLLINDLTIIENWGKENLVLFKQRMTTQVVISCKQKSDFPFHLNGNGKATPNFRLTTWFCYFVQFHLEVTSPFNC